MKATPRLGLAALAALVTLGVFANTALATPEWLFNGSVIGTPLPVNVSSELYVEDMNAPGGAIEVRCDVLFESAIGPGKNGELFVVEGPKGERSSASESKPIECTFVARGICEEGFTPLVTFLALPWATEVMLLLKGVEDIYYDLIKTGKGIDIECRILGTKTVDTCEGNTGMELTNVAEDEVEGNFLPGNSEVTAPLNCSLGGEDQGLLTNNVGFVFKSTEGHIQVSG